MPTLTKPPRKLGLSTPSVLKTRSPVAMKTSWVPEPMIGARKRAYGGARKTSPWRSFQPVMSSMNSSSDDVSLSCSSSFGCSKRPFVFSRGDRLPFLGFIARTLALPSSNLPSLELRLPSPTTVFATIIATTAVRRPQITTELMMASQWMLVLSS